MTRDGEPLALSPLSFELLLALLRAAPDLVSLDELMRRVWPGVVVSPETVSQRVKLVRHALGDDAAAPRYVAGVRGRGYRVITRVIPLERVETAPVTAAPASDGREVASADTPAATKARAPLRGGKGRFRRRAVFATAAVLAALLYATDSGSPGDAPRSALPASTEARARNSLAVLPFANLSGDAGSRSFGAGLAEEILHRLSRSGLRVLARTSSFAYGGSGLDAPTLQALLGVRYLLEGSIRREGSHLRVTVHLVDESGFRVWSGAWRREARGGFAAQDEIAAAVSAGVARQVAGLPPAKPNGGVATTAHPGPGTGRPGGSGGGHRATFR